MFANDSPEARQRAAAFQQGLQELGWIDGRNVRIDYRWTAGDPGRYRKLADELVAFAPDVILAGGTPSVVAMQQATPTVPIIFVAVTDPVGAGIVESLARPSGNTTGFSTFEYGSVRNGWNCSKRPRLA
jgi:putative ABC transport system substrate-binding protein